MCERTGKFKIVVFVPEENLAAVREAMAGAGAGVIGNYTHCSFAMPGRGTFLGGAGADPAVGEAGRLEEVEEWRLEMVAPSDALPEVIAAMKEAHPYEEVAYDVYSLIDP
ncbi:MAG: hypothetical protein PVH29_04760 [Candidatus Zixiibacteriota bacterium]|jgi:hypothetical protein